MANRVGVVAARVVPARLREALALPVKARIANENGWSFVTYSLWAGLSGLTHREIEERLAGLRVPALRAHTEDDSLYRMTLVGPRHTLSTFTQEFDLLERTRGGQGTPAARRSLRTLVKETLAKLAEARIPHDPDEVKRIVGGEAVTSLELEEWGVGNLPRLLASLGMPSAFPGWQDELEKARKEKEDEAAKRARRKARASRRPSRLAAGAASVQGGRMPRSILGRARSMAERGPDPSPVADGPVVVPLAELRLLSSISWACNLGANVVLRLPSSRGATLPRGSDEVAVVVEADGTTWIAIWRLGVSARLGGALRGLAGLPEGSAIELITLPSPGDHRYQGTVRGGNVALTHAAPAVSAATLKAALDLCRWQSGTGPFEAASEAEARAIAESCARSRWLQGQAGKPTVVVRGRAVGCRGSRSFFFLEVFRHRFGTGPWNLEKLRREDERDRARSERQRGSRPAPPEAR